MSMLVACSVVFGIGLFVVLSRRDIIALLIGLELMLGSANVLLVALSTLNGHDPATTQSVGVMVLVLAAAEAALGLALLIASVRRTGRSRVEEFEEVTG
ncbi:MAG: NADH-quinone oxidoreductase subunit NuoK [Coriobacteriia bacterium]|nr:NADH-quinone oxidoreductase subunit NuoK [Coriobacteriia bacterium]